jgi:choline dehydrogenase-like flavoprotein
MAQKFDAIIIGTGQAGPSMAQRMTREGLKTAIIERRHLRQCRLYPHQGAGCQRTGGAYGAAAISALS